MTHTFIEILKSTICQVMVSSIDSYLLVVGPQEFHISIPGTIEFTRLHGTSTISRDSIPDRFLAEEWKVVQAEDMDEVLDYYNAVVMDVKDVDHQLVE
jgi:hypothetical protein